jgi:phosphatidylglycerophosphatase A
VTTPATTKKKFTELPQAGLQLKTMSHKQRTLTAWVAGTCFGIGLLGPGAGTYASVATVLIWIWLAAVLTHGALTVVTVSAAVLFAFVGIWAAGVMCQESGRQDPSEVVIDEVAGQLFALIAAPEPANWKYVLAALILFRTLDILKPPPVSTLERLHGGAGVMLDDVAAGIIACSVLQLVHRLNVGL